MPFRDLSAGPFRHVDKSKYVDTLRVNVLACFAAPLRVSQMKTTFFFITFVFVSILISLQVQDVTKACVLCRSFHVTSCLFEGESRLFYH